MAQRPKVLQPQLSALHLFGARLRSLREAAGLSQTELGRRVAYTGHQIGKVELAIRRPSAELVRRCDEVLGGDGSLKRFAAALAHDDPPEQQVFGEVGGLLPALRRSLDLRDDPDDGEVRDVDVLSHEVNGLVRMRLESDYYGLAMELPLLLPELHRAWLLAPTPQVAMLLTQAYRAADAVADKTGQHDLSARIIDLIRSAAGESGDRLTIATAEYVRAELFFVNHDWAAGRRLLDRAADELNAYAQGTVAAAAVAGALHMRAAVLAARGSDRAAADGHLALAARYAQRVPEGVYRGTAFGPASVRIHEVSLALDTGDIDGAIAASTGWQPTSAVPAERRSHFWLDRSRAMRAAGDHEEAVAALLTARLIAPQHIQPHPLVRAVLTQLIAEVRRPSEHLTQLARWAGVTSIS